jgi:hypothetical protein
MTASVPTRFEDEVLSERGTTSPGYVTVEKKM